MCSQDEGVGCTSAGRGFMHMHLKEVLVGLALLIN